ncbi:UPF0331 protein MA_1296 [hydrothermal vent metagenome]|uniref:UPF0331 protein MA_1296 n=1 Tax=hydrothermal vent metagenome TaxID=652676 RepID=A0A1W1EB47_9ZZZZ
MSLLELLEFIKESIELIRKRFITIHCFDDFIADDDGLEKLDSIILRIQTIGEALKNIDKHQKGFLEQAATTDYWSNIIKLRDLISHHYINIDAETIYMICDEKLDELEENVSVLMAKIKS